MRLSARIVPKARAAATKAGSAPGPEPQYTQIRFSVLISFHIGMHRRDRSVAGNTQSVDVFAPRIPYIRGRPGPMSESHIRSADRMKRDVSGDAGGALFRTLVRLWPYIWPSDRRDLQWRGGWATPLLFGGQLSTVAGAFPFQRGVGALTAQGS